MAASFPNANLPWLAPFGVAGTVWTWRGRSPGRAALIAYLEGLLFFAIVFAWFGETVGAYVGPLAPLLDLAPAAAEAPAFAVTAMATAWAARSIRPGIVPVFTALAFALTETARTSGVLGVPFATLAEPLATTWLRPLAAFGGGAVLTFTVVLAGATLAAAIVERRARTLAATLGTIAFVVVAANLAWPARHIVPPTTPVVAIQGNIKQNVKWTPSAFALAVERYIALTETVRSEHPAMVVWPESVIPAYLNAYPSLQARFAAVARALQTTLIVGTDERVDGKSYNALWYYDRAGRLTQIYRKRRLVPFAESFPGEGLLRGPLLVVQRLAGIVDPMLPSTFSPGTDAAVIDAGGIATAPLICWESGFAELAQAQIRRGADVLVIATDDAWFGETGGPYQHAQIAQLRAVESGRWVVRAAATGISGIIAPDGRFVEETALDTQAVVRGRVGAAQPTLFSRLGPGLVASGMFAALTIAMALGRRRV